MRIERLLRLPSGRSINSVLGERRKGHSESDILSENGLEGLSLNDAMLYCDEAEAIEFNSNLDLRLSNGTARYINSVPRVDAPINLIFGTPHSGVHEAAVYLLSEGALHSNTNRIVYSNFRYNPKHGMAPRRLYEKCSKLKEEDPQKAELLSRLVLDLYNKSTVPWEKTFSEIKSLTSGRTEFKSNLKAERSAAGDSFLVVNPRLHAAADVARMATAAGKLTIADTRVGSLHDLSLASHWQLESFGGAKTLRSILSKTASFVEQRLISDANGKGVAIRRALVLAEEDRSLLGDDTLKLSRVVASLAARFPSWKSVALEQAPELIKSAAVAQQLQVMDSFSSNQSKQAIAAILGNTKSARITKSNVSTPNMSM